ncbi:acVLRF1 family peptidyl-tRNA hydrolase [Arthrobacter agilis]|uniref:acVLRF1 family peptidyl-tRNA hydrolase n=1 Tax=Arthrobacter agilis TaxID=37921 RepID=UPI002366FC10|nr:acVLRF1 family peptidyl-tRNA hydrolase [Arthrobacter agilis]WDF31941.1 acVLRF1 family peptidyl-tRNA hydrolase [Arthrobacter agilis]
MSTTRSVLVEQHRLEGWLSRFESRNGPYTAVPDPDRAATVGAGGTAGAVGSTGTVLIVARNGCSAVLTPPLPAPSAPGDVRDGTDHPPVSPADGLAALLRGTDPGLTVGLLLIRRGGYSVGVARSGQVVSSKTGTRYVQGRTAAGGWSQQRFARRRANQADALVEETAGRAAALYRAEPPSCLQLGGDRALAEATLAESVLTAFAGLPQVPFITVPDPRFAVLKDAARTALAVRITVTDPPIEEA